MTRCGTSQRQEWLAESWDMPQKVSFVAQSAIVFLKNKLNTFDHWITMCGIAMGS